MSVFTKEALVSRYYCQEQDEKVSLNDIAKIVTALNDKTLQLRNEVNAFKNTSANVDTKFSEKSQNTCGQFAWSCYEKCPDIFRSDVKLPQHPKPSDPIKIRKKKISRNVQCNLLMERKKRSFLDYFKIRSFTAKGNKKAKDSAKMKDLMISDSHINNLELTSSSHPSGDVHLKNCEGCPFLYPPHLFNKTIDSFESSQNIKRKNMSKDSIHLQRNKVSKIQLNDHQEILHKYAENEHQDFKSPITGRIGGGAEFRGNRLIADLNDKMHKINLYKHVKLDAKNVKNRLDACIAELNGIIEDVSLIFPEISKE